jgi:quercetin dioxygenase-like cupin family protein
MEKRKKKILLVSIIMGLVVLLFPSNTFAQQSKINRVDLQRHDLSAPGYEAIQVRVEFERDAAFGMHSHPGEEIIYVLEGTFVYEIEGELPVTLKAGDVLFIPAGKNHSAKNIGKDKAAELATYTVEKGKPLLVMKKQQNL